MAFSNSPGLLENDVFEDAVFRGATTDTFVVVSQTPERLSVASPSSVSSSSSSLCNREWRAADLTGGGSLASLMCCTDERDRVQKKTFTKWVNKHLMKHWKKEVRKHVNDMYEDLRDGHNLISLLEVLSGEKLPRERDIFKQLRLPREKGRMRFHRLHNVQIALDFLRLRQIKLVNIRSDDIADGNPKLTLGLIWTIILHFQIADIQVSGQSEDMTAKDRLLLWSQRMVEGYPGIRCDNFTTSWRDGRLFNAIIHRHRPELIDMKRVAVRANRENLEQAFTVAERDMGVTRLLDPEDVDVPSPDEKSIITYVSSLYDVIPRMPEVNSGLNANEVELRWTEYQEIVVIIMQWIRQYIIMFQTRANSANPTDLRAQYNQLVHFREVELPAKEAERLRMKSLFMMMENLIQSGHIKMPVGYHPSDMDKEWNKMLLTMSERERELKIEIDRLDMLQRVAGKIQKDALVCEDRLNQSSSMLQMDIRALENHRAPQHEADIERALNECDAMIRELFIDVQTLKDGRFFQAELMYRRVFQLHERFVSIRSEYKTTVGAANVGSEVISVKVPTIQVTSPRPQDDSNMKYVRDLLAWVEEHQAQIEKAEWGPDLPSVEGNLETHREFNRTIEDFRSSINEAKAGESKISPANRGNYADYFGRLELQYTRLLNMSRSRLRHLESLHAFVVRATKELMWLNDREEEEVNYDWSERNHNMSTKKEQHAVLMKELEQKESIINGIQDSGEQLLASNHPARQTIESYLAAMQTQWNWILQICCCIETHIKENTAYFQFFKEAKDVEEGLKSLQETIRRKYTCDKASSLTRLEDIVQDSMDEKEQLLEYKRLVSGLVSRAKTIVQLKPRSPENRVWSTLPVKAICDFKQQEITIYKNDECVMEDNAQCTKWKIINPIGNEALVPSVCFLIAPPNKDAIELATRMDQSYQNSMTLWHQLHVNMKSVISYLYLTKDIECIRSWTVTTFKTMPPDQYESVMKNLEVHYEDFLEDSRDSQLFSSTDRMTLERDMSSCKQYFDQLLITLERDERDESICSTLLVQLQAIRRRLEASEDRMIRNIRSPLEQPDPVQESSQRIMEHEKLHQDLEDVKVDLSRVVTECSEVLAQGNQSGSSPMLSSELNHTTQKMDQLHSLSTIYLERLKNIDAVVRSSQGAETIVRTFENRLCEDDTLPTDVQGIEAYKTQLKQWRSEVEQKKAVFFAMEDELQRARSVNERMLRSHGERDVDLDQQRHKVEQLLERWAGVQTQIDYRLRELDNLAKLLRSYREGSGWLLTWVDDTLKLQEKLQATKIEDVRGLEEQLEREKNLANDIEKNQIKVDESQKSSDQYHSAAKEYEMHLLIYKATADTHGGLKSPIKRRRLVSTSDSVLQEYMTLRTRYTALVTMTSQYVKFLNETLKRLQDEQKRSEKVTQQQAEHTQREVDTAIFRLTEIQVELERQRQLSDVYAQEKVQAEREADKLRHIVQEEAEKRRNTVEAAAVQKQAIEQEMVELKNRSESEVRRQATLVEEVLTQRRQIEEEIRVIRVEFERTARQKADAEGELARLRALAEEAAKQRQHAEQEAARYRSLAEEEASKKKLAEEELQKKVAAEQTAANQKRQALLEVERLKKMAEEAQKKKDQAEEEAKKQIRLAKEVAQQSIEVEIQARRVSFVEKVNELEQSRQQEHTMMTALQEESQRRKKMVEDAERARQAAEMELEKWRQKADEALRLKLQAEKQAQQKSLALEEAEKQKSEAERETSRRTQSQESTLRQKVMAEEELERQRAIAEETSQQKLQAEQELIRLRAIMADSEQQKSLLDEELMRLKAEVAEAVRQKKVLEEELAKVRAQMEELIRLKHRTEEENKKKSKEEKEKTQKIMEEEALKMKELAEEAARLRATADEAMRQRHLAEEEATHQRAEAERILKEKLNAIQETSKLKAEAEITLKERERENERLKRLAEEEAHQRRMLQEQATQQKQAIEEEMARIRQQSDLEMQRQKALVDETIIQRRLIEEEIHILKIEFEKASKGKLDLEGELKRLKIMADETTRLKENAEEEANKQKKIAMDETMRKKEAQEEVSRKTVAEQQAAQQWKAAMEELEKLKRKADEAMMLKQKAEDEAARQVKLAHEAAQTRINAEEMARQAALAEKDAEMKKLRQREEKTVEQLRLEADRTRKAAEQAEKARIAAEKEASMIRQQAEEALVLKLRAEQQAELKARLQEEAEKHRREAEHEAGKRTQAEEAALRLKALAEAEAERQKRIAVETQKQKSMAEQELTRLRTILEDSDHQKSILEEELMRMKGEVAEAIRQKGLVEEELARLKAQMEELLRLKAQNEMDNRKRAANDSENMKKMLEEEAAKMKQLAEEAARLRTNSDESARLRKQAEEELAQQRALAERLAREKLQAIQEASQLRAEAQAVQRQFDQAQERAKKLSEDRTEIQKKLEVETQTFQRTLEQERQRQHEVNIEAERLRMLVSELTKERARAQEESISLKSQMDEINSKRVSAERHAQEKIQLLQKMDVQKSQTDNEASRLRATISELERERERLKKEAEKAHTEAHETVKREETEITHKIEIMQKQLKEDSVKYQRERESMLQKQRILDEEKARLERTLETELGKARSQLEAEARMRKQQEEENARLRAQMEETLRKQKLYEDEFQRRQREALDLEKTRSDEEKKRAEQENKELLRKLKSLEEETKRQNEQKKLELEKLEQERKLEIQRLEEQRRIELQRIEEQKKIEMQALIEKTNATQTNGEIEVDKAKTNGTSSGSSTIETTYIYSEIETQKEFKNTMMDIPCGQFSGKQMSVWEVLYNTSLINENKRNELLSQYRTGKVTIKRIIIIIIEIITRITSFSFDGLRRKVTLQELMSSGLITQKTANDLESGTTSVEEVSHSIRNYLDGFIGIAGLYIEATKEKLSIYSAIKRGLLRPGTGLVLLEAQAATGFIVDPVRNLKFSVDEAAQKALVGQEYRDKLLSAERAVTGYKDPYSGKTISLFQAMKKGLILKDHGIRLLEAQIATGGIIDPQASHRLPVEVAYKRGLFDKEMNQILLDPSDDTKGFFDPNTEENLTYLDLMQRCITDADTGLCLLPLKEKKKERKMSSKSSVRKRRVIIIDPDTNRELTVSEAYRKGLIDHETYVQLSGQECEWEEIVTTGSDGVVTSVLVDRRSGRQYSVEEAIAKGSLDPSAIEMYRSGQLSITDFGDLLTGNQSSKSTSSIQSKSSSFPMSPLLSPDSTDSIWSDPTEESSAIGGILDTQKLEKISVAEAMRRKLVDNFTGQRLVEAQACTGGILDPFSGKRYTIKAAVTEGLIDSRIGQMISASEKAFIGFEDPITKAKLGILPAMNKGLLTYESGRRYLEAQYLTGGMVEPGNPKRLTLEEALPKGLVDQSNMKKLRDVATHFKYLTCPKTRARMSYKDALDRSMVDADNGIRLLEASGVISSSGGLGSAYGSLTSSKASSRQGSRRGSIDLGSGSGSSFGGLGSSGYSSTSYNSMSYSGMGSGGFSSGSYTQRRY
uniref:Plectin isoform X13 n=1 Tax=Petromyzon marinus TaxID=7757 RepID=A0AAJ7WZA1_PETMA|nr:plectin isoform X13 [Petromyzon marinus]